MLDTSKVFEAISISLHVSFVSTLFAFLLSIFFGYLIATKKFILKKYVVSVLGSLTSIPTVCAGLIVYLIISRSGPLGWMELLYTPSAMIIAQFIIIFPICVGSSSWASGIIINLRFKDFVTIFTICIIIRALFYNINCIIKMLSWISTIGTNNRRRKISSII